MAKKLLKVVGAASGIGYALNLGKTILGGGKKKPAAAVAAPTERVMPLADDEMVKRAQRASILRQRGTSGRSSTILSGTPGATLGGG